MSLLSSWALILRRDIEFIGGVVGKEENIKRLFMTAQSAANISSQEHDAVAPAVCPMTRTF